MTFFNLGRANHLIMSRVVSDNNFNQTVAWWMNGRIFNHYISWSLPWVSLIWKARKK